jgi:hypothetical protein
MTNGVHGLGGTFQLRQKCTPRLVLDLISSTKGVIALHCIRQAATGIIGKYCFLSPLPITILTVRLFVRSLVGRQG